MQIGSHTAERRNLVDLMDSYFRLYAPVLTPLLQQFPKAHGISTFIGREKPEALLEDADGHSYSSKSLDRKVAKLLTPLVDDTMKLQRSCRITENRDEPVTVTARRVGEEIAVQVTVSDRLGSISASRFGQCAPAVLDAFFVYPPEIRVTAGSKDPSVMEALLRATEGGFVEAVKAAADMNIILNYPAPGYDEDFELWFAEFPREEADPAQLKQFVKHFHVIRAQSSQNPVLIMAPSHNYDDVAAKFSRNVVERLEFESGSFTVTP